MKSINREYLEHLLRLNRFLRALPQAKRHQTNEDLDTIIHSIERELATRASH